MAELTSAELANGHMDQKDVPPPHSSPLSLPPARAQTQPTGFPSPLTTIAPISGSVPPLHPVPVNGILLHPSSSSSSSFSSSFSSNSSSFSSSSASSSFPSPSPAGFSRARFIAELQLGMRQVAGPVVSVSAPAAIGSNGGAGGGGPGEVKRREDEEQRALQSAFAAFFALSPALQSDCLHFFLSDGALLAELVAYFLQPSSGQANDVICQWLYDVHWNAFHPQTPSATGGVLVTTVSSSAPPPSASLFLLHLVPVLVFSFLYRSQRALPAPGVAAVLLGMYNVRRLQAAVKGSGGRFIDPQQLTATLYGAPNLALPTPSTSAPSPASSSPSSSSVATLASAAHSPPAKAGAQHPQQQQQAGSSLSPGAAPRPGITTVLTSSSSPGAVVAAFPAMTELNASSISLLIHVVLSHFIAHLSLVSLISQQQFAYVCALLSDNHCEGEIHRTLREFAFAWGGDWEERLAGSGAQTAAAGGKKHVKVRMQQRESDDEEEDSERNGPRYQLNAQLLQDLLVGLTYCACYPGTKSLSLLSLRAIHCRAVEELMPAVLLQTTAILELVEE